MVKATKGAPPISPASDGHFRPHINSDGICVCPCRKCFDNRRPIGHKNICEADKRTPAIRAKCEQVGISRPLQGGSGLYDSAAYL